MVISLRMTDLIVYNRVWNNIYNSSSFEIFLTRNTVIFYANR